jgi:hypothetical protein
LPRQMQINIEVCLSADSIVKMEDSDPVASSSSGKPESNSRKNVTFRQLRRANTIIEAVRTHRVIDDPTKLYKMIQENEVAEGYDAKMDKKSLLRLLTKLGNDGQIKNILVKLRFGGKAKTLHFVCEPNVDETHEVIKSAVEQAKMKFHILPRREAKRLQTAGNEDDDDDASAEGERSTSVAESRKVQCLLLSDP